MYVIREVFTARPGMASRLARLMREASQGNDKFKVRVLTDFIGPFNTVVLETEIRREIYQVVP